MGDCFVTIPIMQLRQNRSHYNVEYIYFWEITYHNQAIVVFIHRITI